MATASKRAIKRESEKKNAAALKAAEKTAPAHKYDATRITRDKAINAARDEYESSLQRADDLLTFMGKIIRRWSATGANDDDRYVQLIIDMELDARLRARKAKMLPGQKKPKRDLLPHGANELKRVLRFASLKGATQCWARIEEMVKSWTAAKGVAIKALVYFEGRKASPAKKAIKGHGKMPSQSELDSMLRRYVADKAGKDKPQGGTNASATTLVTRMDDALGKLVSKWSREYGISEQLKSVKTALKTLKDAIDTAQVAADNADDDKVIDITKRLRALEAENKKLRAKTA